MADVKSWPEIEEFLEEQEAMRKSNELARIEGERSRIANLQENVEKKIDELLEDGTIGDMVVSVAKACVPDAVEDQLGFMVYFGLTDDGYFVAYCPESWDDVEFDTGATYGEDDYGRLVLKY